MHDNGAPHDFERTILLDLLGELWKQNPSQRFGQLVMNLSRVDDEFADVWEWDYETWRRRTQSALLGNWPR